MADRGASRARFLKGTPWENWTVTPLASDASVRRYERLTGPGDQSVILMGADPAMETGTADFIRLAGFLRESALAAPEVLKSAPIDGYVMLTDLGRHSLAETCAKPAFEATGDVLLQLARLTPPNGLATFTAKVAADALQVTEDWYATELPRGALQGAMRRTMDRLAAKPDTLALRDFHAENLIWRPDRQGTDRIGLLDFQDAMIAPAGYDLVSLLRDVRRDVPREIQLDLRRRYLAETSATDGSLACLAVQRNLRILGVFARLAKRDRKRRYLSFLPRLWRLLQEDLTHPDLTDLRDVVAQVPNPAEVLL